MLFFSEVVVFTYRESLASGQLKKMTMFFFRNEVRQTVVKHIATSAQTLAEGSV